MTSVAGSAGLLEELIDQGLTDPAGNVLVHRLHRLAHRSILFRRQGHDLGLAGFLDLRKRVFAADVPAIRVLVARKTDVDARDIGERKRRRPSDSYARA